ncbi:uncharacterized protein LOC122067992 [Macadamia integrifolia]|uniref:uncharacterized protein LOC122067992 n=1 Tax=Macadamia integrifolia TaxID=60698 RepID=UPI001C4F408A|nr:uncharacterized protein LOC122067992 [Macadamia integrifolia]
MVRSGVTRFATSFLTLQSLYKNKDALKQLFVSDDWNSSKLSKTEAESCKIQDAFMSVIERMVPDLTVQDKIIRESQLYRKCEGSFSRSLAFKQRIVGEGALDPISWWQTHGSSAPTLQQYAIRILGLCCSASGCERNWSTFDFIHTKKRNRLEHQRLNDLVYIQYNRRLHSRFQERREKGNNCDPLILDEMNWISEWITGDQEDGDLVHPRDDLTWGDVDRAVGASTSVGVRNLPRRAQGSISAANICYTRRGRGRATIEESSDDEVEEEVHDVVRDDEDIEEDFGDGPTDSMNQQQQEAEELDVDLLA